jgi:hypothetical protein
MTTTSSFVSTVPALGVARSLRICVVIMASVGWW